MNSIKTQINRIIIALILAVSCAFIYVAVVFISMQPEGALRAIWLLTLFNVKALIASIIGFVLSIVFIKIPTKQIYFIAITLLILSVVFWGLIDDPPLSDWLLPPVKGK